ncbi:hypothetical protein [Carboxylicivirga marina]|uniref:Choloylglycine hydrolase/NAAA C-terminal domain-containing protein n=1 Tax=Carboxylicivirga marina TaxID=2800988 RepID=A0ABS1HE57_9BACT|nr:hypothetical protein [Carboxylicivirga marina]MBK3515900.1 hypothetical protein [Carboxylicivirga marina]
MKNLFLALLALLIAIPFSEACTTAVISGKYTANSRPIIWKLRDTETFENKMRYFRDGKYDYIGMINSKDANGEQVWGGSNAAGFAIMNSASFNPQYVLENLLHIEIASKQVTSLFHLNSSEPCYVSFR